MASRRTRNNTSKPPRAAAPASTVSDLPEAAVAAILRHVPLQQRLSSCALVCRAWAAAAAAAPVDVAVGLHSDKKSRQLQDWLAQHGGVVEALGVVGYSCTHKAWQPLQLPVTRLLQLRKLTLVLLRVQSLPAAAVATRSSARRQHCPVTGSCSSIGSSSGSAGALPQLQSLRLAHCRLTKQLLSQLLSATQLSKVHLSHIGLVSNNWTRSVPHEQVCHIVWQQLALLPNLSELSLQNWVAAADITLVSTLQRLEVSAHKAADAAAIVAAAPASLIVLSLTVEQGGGPGEAVFDRLRGLQHFNGVRVHLQPGSLGSLTGLQHLKLVSPAYPGSSKDGARELLAALGALTQLRELDCCDCKLHLIGPQEGYECFAALTASSHLTCLRLHGYDAMPVPQAGVDHMFVPGKVLPHLKSLLLRSDRVPDPAHSHLHPCVEAAQVARIAACCPVLTRVNLCNVTPVGFDRSCLLQLPPGVRMVEGLYWFRPDT